jgi:D-serine deaminase-like pyridoxal phosphate-dependent protein
VNKVIISAGVLVLALVLSGCGFFPGPQQSEATNPSETISEAKASIKAESSSKPSVSETSSPTPSGARTEVVWTDYEPGTQIEIDRMTNAKDCLGINSFFGMATATEDSVKARTGHGNEALTRYLNESLALAQCE